MARSFRRLMTWRLIALLVLAPLADAATPSVEPVETIVARTSKQVSAYLDQVSDVTCTERVRQTKFSPNGKEQYSAEDTYNYFVLLQGNGDDLLLSESRLPSREEKDKAAKPAKVSLLLTNGFSTLFLIFHPYYVGSYRFETAGEEMIGSQRWLRVHFSPVPGARTPAALAVRSREYPLELAGDAWIDPATGMIGRIQASLAGDLHDVGLRKLNVEVAYAPVKLPAWEHAYLFPSVATIEVETPKQHWRNVHRFSDYKSFMVGTDQNIADQELGKVTVIPNKKDKKKKK
jgi:hypothetical protein